MYEGRRTDQAPDEAVRLLENSDPPDTERLPKAKGHAGPARNLEEQYYRALEEGKGREVHSYPSLHASRQHALALLALLPDYNKTELASKCLEQELKLQESIRNRSYSDSEFLARMRRFLTLLYGFGGIGFGAFLVSLPLFHTVDASVYKQQIELAKWLLGSGLAVTLAYFFRGIHIPWLSQKHKDAPHLDDA